MRNFVGHYHSIKNLWHAHRSQHGLLPCPVHDRVPYIYMYIYGYLTLNPLYSARMAQGARDHSRKRMWAVGHGFKEVHAPGKSTTAWTLEHDVVESSERPWNLSSSVRLRGVSAPDLSRCARESPPTHITSQQAARFHHSESPPSEKSQII